VQCFRGYSLREVQLLHAEGGKPKHRRRHAPHTTGAGAGRLWSRQQARERHWGRRQQRPLGAVRLGMGCGRLGAAGGSDRWGDCDGAWRGAPRSSQVSSEGPTAGFVAFSVCCQLQQRDSLV